MFKTIMSQENNDSNDSPAIQVRSFKNYIKREKPFTLKAVEQENKK